MPAPAPGPDALRAALPGLTIEADGATLSDYAHDWWPRLLMRRRAGEQLPTPMAVVRPEATAEVAALLQWCHEHRLAVVPFGAGTGVCGGAAPVRGAVTMDLRGLNDIGGLDEVSGTITVDPGVIAQRLEDHLEHRGWTLGHFPSSIHCSTIGGFLAIRSAGQASTFYGKLEDMVVALEVVLADGTTVRTPEVPQSAAGPDLTRLFLGGEGTTGVITSATLRIWPAPEVVRDHGWLLPDVPTGLDALRAIMRTGVRPAVVRLYDEQDTAIVFSDQELDLPEGCLVIIGCEGDPDVVELTHAVAARELDRHGGRDLGPGPGENWRANRHSMSYRFAEYMKPDGAFGDAVTLDTMEVAGLWGRLPEIYSAVRAALEQHVDLVLAHVSHVYPEGGCIYFTLGAANDGDEEAALARYDAAWEAGIRACHDAGGSMSHHHGVGLLRAPHLERELGPGGMAVLRRVKSALDPRGILNPGKLGLGGGDGD